MAVNLQRIPFIAAARAQRPGILNPSHWLQGGRYLLVLIGVLGQIGLMLTGAGGAGLMLPTPDWRAVLFVGVGILFALLARYRALEIGVASGTIVFAKRSLELDTLSRIDEIRERRLDHFKSGATEDAQIS